MKFLPIFFLSFTLTAIASTPVEAPASKEGCLDHICIAEKQKGLPEGLLQAIAQIESKLNPFIVNAAGKAHFFSSRQAAADFVREKQKQGFRNISVGPMQLHVPSHRHRFNSLEDMLDPQQNIAYAAALLKRLEKQHGSAEAAVRHYHSPNPVASRQYQNRVFGAWAKIKNQRKLVAVSHTNTHETSQKPTPPKVKSKPVIKFNYGLRQKSK